MQRLIGTNYVLGGSALLSFSDVVEVKSCSLQVYRLVGSDLAGSRGTLLMLIQNTEYRCCPAAASSAKAH